VKVFVVVMSAPAAKYASCTSRTICGCVRFSRSGSFLRSRGCAANCVPRKSASVRPRLCKRTPHAPSRTRILSAASSRMRSALLKVSDTDGVRHSRLAASRYGEHVLGVAHPLLGLPAVGRRLAALDRLQLGLRGLELLARTRIVDLRRLDGVVDESDRAVLEHLEEAGAGRKR